MAEVLNFNLDEFGINASQQENKYKQALLNLIYTANDKESEHYYEMLLT